MGSQVGPRGKAVNTFHIDIHPCVQESLEKLSHQSLAAARTCFLSVTWPIQHLGSLKMSFGIMFTLTNVTLSYDVTISDNEDRWNCRTFRQSLRMSDTFLTTVGPNVRRVQRDGKNT